MSCPTNDTIAELVCRRLAEAKAAEVEAHVADCAPCRRLVGTLAAGSLWQLGREAVTVAERYVAPGAPRAAGGSERYVVREELARGGMGRISIADDTLLGRTVAIKELLAPSAELAARFQRELALTSRLQHPSIVSIHDGGTWASGEPFYVMRLVSGEPLDRVIARHDAAARIGLLPHGIAMVDALAYAHSQGIVHRDLKPANVLVGDFGETVVIDWGLARDLRAPADDDAGRVVGTPAYMAPEQARGEASDERGDVYALGAVLYHLLAGEAPYRGTDIDAILAAVRAAPPRPLAEVARGAPPDLLAIVGKAMARAPADRYPGAGDLAADLKRFQRGQLVGAHRYSSWQLARRWIRKHRTAVAVGGVAAAVLAAVIAISFRRVLAEEAVAEQHRADAQELMRFMSQDLHVKLKPIGRLDLLGAVADKEREYYRTHLDDRDRYDRVVAYGNLGEVMFARGDAAGALAQYREALALAQQVQRDNPTEPKYLRQVSTARTRVATVLADEGDNADAILEFRAAIAIDHQLADQDPADVKAQDALVLDELRLGRALEADGHTDEALALYHAGVASAAKFSALDPKSGDWLQLLAEAHEDVGNLLLKRGDATGGLVEVRAALAAGETVADIDPSNADYQRDLAAYHLTVGGVLEVADPAGGLAEYRAALAIAERLVAKDPANSDWNRTYWAIQNSIGSVLDALGDKAGALAAYRAGLASAERAAKRAPGSEPVQRGVFAGHMNIGYELSGQGDKSAGAPEFQLALPIAEKLAAANPTNVDGQRDVAAVHNKIGVALDARGDHTGALAAYRAAVDISERLAKQDPANAQVQHDLFNAVQNAGDVVFQTGDLAGALAEFDRAAKIAQAEVEHAPGSPDAQQDLFDSHTKHGNVLAAQDKSDGALVEYRAALAIADKAAAQPGAMADWQESLALVHDKIAGLLRERHDERGAQAELRAAIAAVEQLAARDPTNPAWKSRIAELRGKLR